MQATEVRRIRFSVLGNGRSRTGIVRNGKARLGDVAPSIARRLGLAGAFECLDVKHNNRILPAEIRLDELPTDEVAFVSEHTPA